MRLTTKGRYAVTAMLDLALHALKDPVALADISVRQGISLSYLEQLFSKLRQHSLVKSIRGPGGGYLLNKPVTEISIADVIDAVDESLDTTRCKEKGNCQDGETCLTHHLWLDLSTQIHHFLSKITLQDLMNKREVQITALRQDQQAELINARLLNL
jgi:Rrf2 family iron-sulfur cluster assembly transcriptional regulator